MYKVEKFEGNIDEIVEFYKDCNYTYHPKENETILVAKNNNKIVGVVRLSKEKDILHLRGMQILPEERKKGIGTKLLKFCDKLIGTQRCYLVGYPHLVKFYNSIGFGEIDLKSTPLSVQERFKKAKERFPETSFTTMERV